MDRVQFLNVINVPEGSDSASVINSFFDQYMVLYNMTGNQYNVVAINILNADFQKLSIQFRVEFRDEEDANRIQDTFQSVVDIYDKKFVVEYYRQNMYNMIITINRC